MTTTNTTQATKNATINALIVGLTRDGMSVRDAVNAVLGAGTYEKLAGEVYDALRAKAGK